MHWRQTQFAHHDEVVTVLRNSIKQRGQTMNLNQDIGRGVQHLGFGRMFVFPSHDTHRQLAQGRRMQPTLIASVNTRVTRTTRATVHHLGKRRRNISRVRNLREQGQQEGRRLDSLHIITIDRISHHRAMVSTLVVIRTKQSNRSTITRAQNKYRTTHQLPGDLELKLTKHLAMAMQVIAHLNTTKQERLVPSSQQPVHYRRQQVMIFTTTIRFSDITNGKKTYGILHVRFPEHVNRIRLSPYRRTVAHTGIMGHVANSLGKVLSGYNGQTVTRIRRAGHVNVRNEDEHRRHNDMITVTMMRRHTRQRHPQNHKLGVSAGDFMLVDSQSGLQVILSGLQLTDNIVAHTHFFQTANRCNDDANDNTARRGASAHCSVLGTVDSTR